MPEHYNHKEIDKKWQEIWEKDQIYFAKDNTRKPKKLVLVEFPYPSGEGLHMGHLRPYLAGDVYSRFLRMNGHEVMYPMGWDAFGLPAENYAIKNKVHPSVSTARNVENAKGQLKRWGTAFDWGREVNTTDPQYYKWTQWIFLQFFKKGLAYEATGLINWCPKDKTGLANEEVVDGKCERCGTEVEKKELRQWYLKITQYAEKLLEGLKTLDWADRIKLQQENWIGKSQGIEIDYEIIQDFNYVLLHGFNGSPEKPAYKFLKNYIETRGYKVQLPALPNPATPSEEEQVDYVLKNVKFDEKTILYGKSLGSVIAMKVLEKLDKPIAGLILVGGFLDGRNLHKKYPFADTFNWQFDFKNIKKKVGFIKILSDLSDQEAVPVEQGRLLHQKLGGHLSEAVSVEQHFVATEEPEVLNFVLPKVKVYTTRPDTNFGATFVVLGPEHPFLRSREILNIDEKIWQEIKAYQEKAASTAEMDRTAENRKKTGVFTGLYCIHKLNGSRMPIYVTDYVLGHVGTGAVVGVPGHDKRDFEFAEVFNLPVVRVVQKDENDNSPITTIEQVQEEEGVMVNSEFLNGLDIHEATKKIMDHMEAEGYGKRVTNYKLRDWVFSRQRYWGEPIPLVHCEKCGIVAVPDDQLPVKLPDVKEYEPTGTGESPLAAISDWVNTTCPNCSGPAKRETNTMPQWAGSSWYWLRYSDAHNDKEFASMDKLKYWQPVDVYFGGMEHTTLHLLYSRFWNLFMYDQGLVTHKEPYVKRIPHGIILAADGEKMSKSRGNVVNPDSVIEQEGADALRLHEMFLGPHEATVSWNDKGLVGIKRFLDKVWRFVPDDSVSANNAIHSLIEKISTDIAAYKFNTAIAGFMEFLNDNKALNKSDWEMFLKLLSPFAPHITEEVWHNLGNSSSIHTSEWPKADAAKTKKQVAIITVQVNGKLRGTIPVLPGATQEEIKGLALSDPNIAKHMDGKQPVKEIFVPDKLINFVVK